RSPWMVISTLRCVLPLSGCTSAPQRTYRLTMGAFWLCSWQMASDTKNKLAARVVTFFINAPQKEAGNPNRLSGNTQNGLRGVQEVRTCDGTTSLILECSFMS